MRNYLLLFLLVLFAAVSCKKEKTTSAPHYLFEGKLRSITEKAVSDGIPPISYFFIYDSTTQNLVRVEYASDTTLSHRDTIIVSTKDEDGFINISNSYRIKVNGKQVDSIYIIPSVVSIANLFKTGSTIDSMSDAWWGILKLMSRDFVFSDGNCTSFTASWDEIGPPTKHLVDTLHLSYTNYINKNQLWYQQPVSYSATYNSLCISSFLLNILQQDGYYMFPINKNLIEKVTGKHKTINFAYEFDDRNLVKKVIITRVPEDITAIGFQTMTYY